MTFDSELMTTMQRAAKQEYWSPLEMVEAMLKERAPHAVDEPVARSLTRVDFQGKSVVDLGSNIGLYAFEAALLGAREVVATDFGPDIVRMGNLLAEKYGLPQVRFELVDFAKEPLPGCWDVAMMLNIIGNNKVRKGRVDALMDVLLGYSEKELLCNVRPVYAIQEELGVPPEALQGLYPQEHLRHGRLYLLEYLQARHGGTWEIRMLAEGGEAAGQDKPALHFLRR